MGNCVYCSVKISRGRVKSKPIDAIVQEFRSGLAQGYNDFALFGTDLGDYGRDIDKDLIDLLETLTSQVGRFRLRLRNVNPRWLIPMADRFGKLLETGKIAYLLTPVESASNRILDLMNRGYHIEEFVNAVSAIRKKCPQIFLKSQVMVGFPGETEDDFAKSIALMRLGLFDYFDVYTYTDRPRTFAAGFPDHLANDVLRKRYIQLLRWSLMYVPIRRLFYRHRDGLPDRQA
ncbi:MAG: radical SAM protein [Chloroflexi bacterium]|nr:radical SAM protein [Chloroflexota bacterium]